MRINLSSSREFNASHIIWAKTVLRDSAIRTPILCSQQLNRVIGANVLYKAELLQRKNSFKFRGAYTHVSQLSKEEIARGIIAASSGNHAQAVALAARLACSRAIVVIPDDCPDAKVAAITAEGADIVRYNRATEDRDQIVDKIASSRGCSVIPSSNGYSVMAGNGTVALEILEEYPDLDTLLVPVGGGGLAAGCATIAKAMNPSIRIIGVEPEKANDTYLSIKSNSHITIDNTATIADGLRHLTPSVLPLEINSRLLDDVVLVTEDEIVAAMQLAFKFLKVVLEPSGACAMAALLRTEALRGSHQLGVVLSGGNIDWPVFRDILLTTASY